MLNFASVIRRCEVVNVPVATMIRTISEDGDSLGEHLKQVWQLTFVSEELELLPIAC